MRHQGVHSGPHGCGAGRRVAQVRGSDSRSSGSRSHRSASGARSPAVTAGSVHPRPRLINRLLPGPGSDQMIGPSDGPPVASRG
jgi:hypothetical protein